jgi:hypothetical protein
MITGAVCRSRHTGECPMATPPRAWRQSVAAIGALLAIFVAGVAHPQQPSPSGNKTACLYLEKTLIPMIAMGVRRVDGANIDALALRSEPSATSPVVREVRLFRPYYVGEKRIDPVHGSWVRLQDGYVATPLGWVQEKDLEPFISRYGYVFAPESKEPLTDLHDSSKDAYARLVAQAKGMPDGEPQTVVIRRRLDPQPWIPSKIDDFVPFLERRRPHDPVEKNYPDTTPTFRFGIGLENRLIHVGAVCGGPLETARLEDLRRRINQDAGLEMLFVIDETESMREFFPKVAQFIDSAAKAAAGRPGGLKIAVSYYTDGPPGQRVRAAPLTIVAKAEDATNIASEVESHQEDVPDEPFSNAPERMLEGIRDAVKKAGFKKGANGFVAVIGDTGHEPEPDADKEKLIDEIANLIDTHNLQVFFAHVGERRIKAQKMFEEDAGKVLKRAGDKYGVADDRIVYQTADANTLQQALKDAQERAEERRRRTQMEIVRMESRNRNTEPGPKFVEQLKSRDIPKEKYDRDHLQYFVPARGWLYHPRAASANGDEAPQFKELFFLSPPEKVALSSLLDAIQERLKSRRVPIDGTVIETFARSLADASGQPAMRERAIKMWQEIPERQRTVGIYLEDVFGLRMKSCLPYAIEASAEIPLSAAEMQNLTDRISRLRAALRADATRFWFDSASLMP